jgi:transketolase
MLNPNAYLAKDVGEREKLEMLPTREGYGRGLARAGEENKDVVVLCADLTESTRSEIFAKNFPERFVEVGVAEQNMASVAAGLALAGKVPFIASYATFSPGRNNEQIRTTIVYNRANVKIAGSHAGLSVGPDGATHQALEDIGLMRMLPGMTVFVPCDANEAEKATLEAARIEGPVYIRLARERTPVFTTKDTPFRPGKIEVFKEGKDAALIACGPILYNALRAALELEQERISCAVLNCHTIKPLDVDTIFRFLEGAGALVTVEEHQIAGGLGGAVAEYAAKTKPVPVEFVGVRDHFGESGTPDELIEKYGLGVASIKEAVKKVISRK